MDLRKLLELHCFSECLTSDLASEHQLRSTINNIDLICINRSCLIDKEYKKLADGLGMMSGPV